MKIDCITDAQGRTTEKIHLTEEENKAVDMAHEIVAERGKQLGIAWTKEDVEHHEFMFLGILRYEGIEKLLNFARTAPVGRGKTKNKNRAYA